MGRLVDEAAEQTGVLEKVVFLGSAPMFDVAGLTGRWLLPMVPDEVALDVEVEAALAARYSVVESAVPPAVADEASELLRASVDPEQIAKVNAAIGVDAGIVALYQPGLTPDSSRVVLRMLGGRSLERARVAQSVGALSGPSVWNPLALGTYAAVALLVVRRFLRVTGSLMVKIPETGENVFTGIHLSTTAQKAEALPDRRTGRYSQSMVGEVTEFSGVRPRHYYVGVRRVVRDPDSNDVLSQQFQQKEIEVKRRQVARLRFDFKAAEIDVPIELLRGEDKVEGRAALGFREQPESLRYIKTPGARIKLGPGEHTLVLGFEGCVMEASVVVEDAASRPALRFDLDDESQRVFDGSGAAAERYLAGDVEGAVRELREAGCEETAHVLQARELRSQGDSGEAARHLAAAGKLQEAAELSETAADTQSAAALYEQAGDLAKAAEQYRQSGDIEAAMRTYEQLGDINSAVSCAMCMGDATRAMELLERHEQFFDAGQMANSVGDVERAIRFLQRVSARDDRYGDACGQLAELFLQREEPEIALQKLDEAADAHGHDGHLELREQIGEQLERAGRLELALEAFEAIHKADIDYSGVAQKIEALREQLKGGAGLGGAGATTLDRPKASRYELLGELGRGGMGVVYKARDKRLGRVVALKRLPENLKEHPTAVKFFLREARSAAALNHPNIVILHDADQEDGVYYLTMEYLDGVGVEKLLEERGKLSLRNTLIMAARVAMGLEYAHAHSIVHRDIKPSNLFYTRDKQLKIMDFGLAKMIEEVRKRSSVIAGTPHFMAPEQALGDAVDHRADLYAFGVTLFQMATGALPFTEGDILYHHRHTPAPDPRAFAPDLPAGFAEVISRLMAKQPDDRFATTSEVVKRLKVQLKQVA